MYLQTAYYHIIMELPTDESLSLELSLTDEQIAKYDNQLNRQMKGKQSSLIARLFKALTGKKVTIPGGSFKSTAGACLYIYWCQSMGFDILSLP